MALIGVWEGCGSARKAHTFHNSGVEDGAEIEAPGGLLFLCHEAWLGRNVGWGINSVSSHEKLWLWAGEKVTETKAFKEML